MTDAQILIRAIDAADAVDGMVRIPRHLARKCLRWSQEQERHAHEHVDRNCSTTSDGGQGRG